MRNALFGPKPTFFQWKINIFDEKSMLFQWAVLSWSLGGLGVVLGGSWGGRWRIDEGINEGPMRGRWRIDDGINEGSVKDRWRDQWRVDEGSMKGSMMDQCLAYKCWQVLPTSLCLGFLDLVHRGPRCHPRERSRVRRPPIPRFFFKPVWKKTPSSSRWRGRWIGGWKVDLQGQDKFHQQGQRAKHKLQNPKKETLYKKSCNSRSTAPGGCYVSSFFFLIVRLRRSYFTF